MNHNPLLRLLADGQIHSGENLASALGVSRTAVWKQIERLQGDGVAIRRIRGKGYGLEKPLDLLDEAVLLGAISPGEKDAVALKLHDEIDSTNSDVIKRWQAGEKGVLVSVADSQSGGRGRQGRVWQSPRGENIYVSFGFSVARGFTGLEGLSLVTGIAVCRALEGLGLSGLTMKWPNDLQVNGEKLGGILIELQGELEGAARVVIGIGLNVHMTQTPAVDQPWTSLAKAFPDQQHVRSRIVGTMTEHLILIIRQFEVSGFEPFRTEWEKYDALRGKLIHAVNGAFEGVADGIETDGSYRVRTETGIERVHAGEISLRVSS
ncbi:biotin--[acetyl-CoA-carboxylase] ligase [uncultured Marinobacter sp.]|uniref:biotin--[acetyl-CoA-carboxylase] ligase n=1 Tax=uncultured Marinobacter sp. TaxID=187379 RepID=UPI0030DAF961